ncbi:alcohol dehydrogenase catalytic domain-containing protein [Roseibium porphyridii]|uniref:Alcohol dehydrogenase catalytic domain-containing protein n=1 Tax=Roseibium porphyridii TaxID=2866279 RepID=A0ABY8FB93_9HYPH|nr:alcohol dehydrogenase catalytic domain-containing protein [Roseibium sp. KMA01]WFE91140.1 alcohol dehydrogenase catalytic domain-containing protein [Roseibium sp. KMA01]
MKALVYTGPEAQSYQDVADPVPVQDEVLIRVAHTGICGSDMHAYLGHDERRPAPLILGHEVAGTVQTGPLSGRHVTVNPLVTCGKCEACKSGRDNLCTERQIISMPPREGGFADYLAMPERNLVTVPDHVSDAQAALAEPIACGWHAVRLARAALRCEPAEARTLVIGGGAIGLGAALSLRAQGMPDVRLVEPNESRGQFLAKTCGIEVLTPEEADTSGQYDLVIDGVGYAATRAAASASVKPGGVIAHIGLGSADGGLDIRRVTLQEITFIGTYTYTAEDFRQTAKAMFEGRLGALNWVEIRPLSEGQAAFADLRAGKISVPKILLSPNT